MSDPNKPKAPPAPPIEGPTKAFVLKMDGLFSDLLTTDLAADLATDLATDAQKPEETPAVEMGDPERVPQTPPTSR